MAANSDADQLQTNLAIWVESWDDAFNTAKLHKKVIKIELKVIKKVSSHHVSLLTLSNIVFSF